MRILHPPGSIPSPSVFFHNSSSFFLKVIRRCSNLCHKDELTYQKTRTWKAISETKTQWEAVATSELNSANTEMAWDKSSGLSTGTNNSYTVSSTDVEAFWQAPNSAPTLSKNLMMSWFVYFWVALKARCSTMCATPRSSSSSKTELPKTH